MEWPAREAVEARAALRAEETVRASPAQDEARRRREPGSRAGARPCPRPRWSPRSFCLPLHAVCPLPWKLARHFTLSSFYSHVLFSWLPPAFAVLWDFRCSARTLLPWCVGLIAPRHMGSQSPSQDRSLVRRVSEWILHHWAPRDVPFYNYFLMEVQLMSC